MILVHYVVGSGWVVVAQGIAVSSHPTILAAAHRYLELSGVRA